MNRITINGRNANGELVMWFWNGWLVNGRSGQRMSPTSAILAMRNAREITTISEQLGSTREELLMTVAR